MGQKEKSLLFFLLNLFVIFKTILNVVLINVDIRSGSRSDKKKKSRRESKHGKRISEPTQRCHKTAVSGFIPEILFMTCDGHFHQEFFFLRYFRTVSSNYAVRQTLLFLYGCMELHFTVIRNS